MFAFASPLLTTDKLYRLQQASVTLEPSHYISSLKPNKTWSLKCIHSHPPPSTLQVTICLVHPISIQDSQGFVRPRWESTIYLFFDLPSAVRLLFIMKVMPTLKWTWCSTERGSGQREIRGRITSYQIAITGSSDLVQAWWVCVCVTGAANTIVYKAVWSVGPEVVLQFFCCW